MPTNLCLWRKAENTYFNLMIDMNSLLTWSRVKGALIWLWVKMLSRTDQKQIKEFVNFPTPLQIGLPEAKASQGFIQLWIKLICFFVCQQCLLFKIWLEMFYMGHPPQLTLVPSIAYTLNSTVTKNIAWPLKAADLPL